jgi:TRAP transporter 4TM/12TM fusion protein
MTNRNRPGRMIDPEEGRTIPADAPLAGPVRRIAAKDWAILGLGVASVSFHLYLIFAGLVPALVARPVHFMLAVPWVFFVLRARSAPERWLGYVLGTLGLAAGGYVALRHEVLVDQYGSLDGPWQMAMALILVLTVLEMARRSVKAVLPGIAAIVLAYGAFGHHVPGTFGHGELPFGYFLGTLTIAEGGIWSSMTEISAETVAPFIILGAFISAGAAGTGFMALAIQLAGRFRAGAAKVAVLSSAMYGTISGVAAANCASTGMVTIPAMKRLGYPPAMAAAGEAGASTGGQIMPPLMGAGVFVMAELLRTEYLEIMKAATPSAVLFFAAVWFGVHMFAIRWNLSGLKTSDLPGWATVARTFPFFAVPFALLLWMLVFTPFTAPYAAAMATVVTALLLATDGYGEVRFRRWAHRIWMACVDGGRQISAIAAIIICASLIVGVFNMTGVGVKVTSLILSASGGNLWCALLLTGLAGLVLGMELPTTAAYIITVAVAGPALIELGLPELHAHLFVFWYALLCTITPPVCGNVFIAAGLANTAWLPVAWRSMQMGIGLFVIPLGFVANPSMLHIATEPAAAVLAFLKVGAGVAMFSFAAIDPYRRWWLALPVGVVGGFVVFACGV